MLNPWQITRLDDEGRAALATARALVFLDVDGVLNHSGMWDDPPPRSSCPATLEFRREQFDPACVERVERLCTSTGAVVVISSSWRIAHSLAELRCMLRCRGLQAAVVGATPRLPDRDIDAQRIERGHEIRTWLDAHGRGLPFVVLDGDGDMATVHDQHVRTSLLTGGFNDEALTRAIAVILGDKTGEPL